MAKIMISNNNLQVKSFINFNIKSGFKDFGQYENNEFSLAVHKKKIHKVDNFIKFQNGDFCSTIGTCIVNNMIGMEAIKELYKIFDSNIKASRSRMIGNYIVVIKKFNKVYIFTDKYSVLKSYYCIDEKNWVFSNSIENIAMTTKNLKINKFGLLQESLLVSSFGSETLFENIFRLSGYEYLEIDCKTNRLNVQSISCTRQRRNFKNKSIEEVSLEYASIIKNKFAIVSKFFANSIRINQTGGLDNRTVLASFLSCGVKPDIMYGVGNSVFTNTKNEDLEICKLYQKKYAIDFYQMNWKDTYKDGIKHWRSLFEKFGFQYSIYGGGRNFFKEFEGKIPNYPKFIECGYYLENLRLREFISNSKKKTMTIEEFVEDYLIGGGYGIIDSSLIPDYVEFKSKMVLLLKEQMKIYGIAPEGIINEENFDEVRWIHARHTDSILVNFLNNYTSSIAMFSIEELHEFPFDVPSNWRRDAKFQLMVINHLRDDILDIPIFSHCQKCTLNKSDFSLKDDKNFPQLISDVLKDIGMPKTIHKKISLIYQFLFSFKSKSISNENQKELRSYINDIITKYSNKNKIELSIENNQEPIVYLMRLAQYLYAIDYCKEKSNDFKNN